MFDKKYKYFILLVKIVTGVFGGAQWVTTSAREPITSLCLNNGQV